jgi:capsular polysaccharide biosynthesis protein
MVDYKKLPLPANYAQQDKHLFDIVWQKKIPFSKPRVYTNVKVTNNLILVKGWQILKESFFAKPYKRLSYKDTFRHIMSRPSDEVDVGAFVTDGWSSGYFHWFADALQRYEMCCSHYDAMPILVLPQAYKSISYIPLSLHALKIPHIYISINQPVKVKNLIVPKFFVPRGTLMPQYIKKVNIRLREMHFLKHAPLQRVYISRMKARFRKIVNEDEVIILMKKYNFRILCMEDLKWEDQMQVLFNTEILVGLHGAGLTGMMLMPENSKILEIRMHDSVTQACYYEMASILGFKYYYCLGNPLSKSDKPHKGNLYIDIDSLESILKQVIQNKE